MLMTFGLFLATLAGLALIEMGLTEPDFELPSRIFGVACGIILAAPGILMLVSLIQDRIKGKKEAKDGEKTSLKEDILEMLSNTGGMLKFLVFMTKEKVTKDQGQEEKLIHHFRDDFHDFFSNQVLQENAGIQSDATQIFWNVLALQKKRLQRKGLTMEMDSQRMRFGSIPAVSKHTYFDGKYNITEISETLQADWIYKSQGREIGKDRSTQMAWFRLLDAKRQDNDKIICPNCGNAATRENLIDGCDYCHTKFTVEDLGQRVSEFGFRADYDLEYDKYRDARSRFSLWVGLIIGVPIAILSLIGMVGTFVSGQVQAGPMMAICAVVLGTLFCTFAAVYFALLGFYFLIFPFVQTFASLTLFTRKRLDDTQKAKASDIRQQKEIRKKDPLFSVAGFYSGVQNKLSTILYSESSQEALAFVEDEAAAKNVLVCRERYGDIVNMDVDYMQIVSYQVKSGVSDLVMDVAFHVTEEKNQKLQRNKKKIRLKMSKNADCHTQAICAPSFLTCPGCGASMTLLEGKTCGYCGYERRLMDVDWAITGFNEYKKV